MDYYFSCTVTNIVKDKKNINSYIGVAHFPHIPIIMLLALIYNFYFSEIYAPKFFSLSMPTCKFLVIIKFCS